jgi:hypothetical protein
MASLLFNLNSQSHRPTNGNQASSDILTKLLFLRRLDLIREKLDHPGNVKKPQVEQAKKFFLNEVPTTSRPTLKRLRAVSPTLAASPKPETKSSKADSKWLSTIEELKEFKGIQGHCIVPRGYAENPRLASWVAEQRKQYKLMKDGKQSSITPERVLMLDELDFAWNAQEAAWVRHMRDLKLFREENGHCHVPLSRPNFPKLGLWVKEQRRHYTLMKQKKQSHMTDERIAALDAVGFCWDTHEATWLERLRELTVFKERYGTCIVPTSYQENHKLATWVHHQRRQYKKLKEGKAHHITKERIQALESLGFVWYPRDRSQSCSSSSDTSTL